VDAPPAQAIDIRDYESVLDQAGADDLRDVLVNGPEVAGDIIECGSWRGGSAMFIADLLLERGVRKRIYACDSYEGFDLDELQAERAAGWTAEQDDAFASTSLKYVTAKIRQRGLEDIVVPIKGYFEETLASLPGPFRLVVVDCDLSRSALFAAETLWGRVEPGGVVLFDDYDNGHAFRGIRPVVDGFVAHRSQEIRTHGLMRRLYRVVKAGSP
jgi:predicted O-methyltransferase YrrM